MKNQKIAVFIVGFQNWGKTSIIKRMFGRSIFYHNKSYNLQQPADTARKYVVMPYSNDDFNETNFLDGIKKRLELNPNCENLVAALCPTTICPENSNKEARGNSFVRILSDKTFKKYDVLKLFLIEYKYDLHAKLLIDNIKKTAKSINHENVEIYVVNSGINLSSNCNDRTFEMSQQILQNL